MECTVNRVGDRYIDQLQRCGHRQRPDDLERFRALGLRTLRYPVLWEHSAPDSLQELDFSHSDERMAELRRLGVRPIVGLLHHGSGPRYTSLLDPELPGKLAAYARAVAERYPWVDAYTPVNEPLTTARFSGLYGHWYPHATDDPSCVRALLLQCRATALAMRAVRSVNPAAQLVQTEDLGVVRSTPLLSYQAAFENERRWLTFDLLCGRVDRQHPLWPYLLWVGVSADELALFQEDPCPPDVLGLNYYVTSERFLDEHIDRYPPCFIGGNGRHSYADVEAVRVCASGLLGLRRLLGQAWQRFHLPLAVTEVHLGCTRREQLRWLHQQWQAAAAARADGVDVRAVTAWALLGSYDWNSLLTREQGYYEPGAFDLSRGARRPTALARLLRALAGERDGGPPTHHPILREPGWWQRSERLLYPPFGGPGHLDPLHPGYAVAA